MKRIKFSYRYDIGYISKRGQKVIEKTRKVYSNGASNKAYLVVCGQCGYEQVKSEYDLDVYGCPVCSNKKVLKGYNDVATTRPDIVKHFLNKEDCFKYTQSSDKRVFIKCVDCGAIKKLRVADISKGDFGCDGCSDGVSFPNKFMFNILKGSGIDFISEYSPDWIKPKKYDFYIPSKKLIIEMDGGWHYMDNKMSGVKKNQMQKVDNKKDDMASNHGIHVIRIECKESDAEYIKANILLSSLPSFIDFSNVDWKHCDFISQKSKLYICCKMYAEGHPTIQIAKENHIHRATLTRYLKKGTELGLCEYDADFEIKKTIKNFDCNHVGTKVRVNNGCKIYKSMSELARESEKDFGLRFPVASIYEAIKNSKDYKGYKITKVVGEGD